MTKKSKVIHRGFTIIEVSLFLALAGLIFIGVTAGITTNITRQRYFDASNDLANYLRSIYSSVVNVSSGRSTTEATTQVACSFNNQNPLNNDSYAGRSGCAIYGKAILFDKINGDTTIRSYDLIGDVYNDKINSNDTLDALKKVHADIISVSSTGGRCFVGTSNPEEYTLSWGTSLQPSKSNANDSNAYLRGVLLVVRSPVTGTVHTYYSPQQVTNVDSILSGVNCSDAKSFYNSNKNNAKYRPVTKLLNEKSFSARDVDICLNTPDLATIGRRRAIRINEDGHNASAVELLAADSPEIGALCP